ncbi:MAG TPA: hypothetical protein VLH10_10200, partial [Yinghuangia sp.]|nr:hypothetical protein [Yinghuangia sp.]
RVYIPDRTSGNLLVYNTVQAMFEDQVKVTGKPGPLETHVRDGLLWVNDAQNATAAVVNVQGQIHLIDKYDTDPSPGTGNGSSVPTPAKSVPEGGVTQSTEAGTPSATASEAPSGATGGKEDPVPNPVDTGNPAPEAPVIPPAIPDPPADNGNQGGNQGGNGSGGNSGRTEPEPDPEPTRRTEPTTEVPRPPVETPEPPTNPITPPWTPPAASTPPPADTPPPPATTPAPPNTTPPAATTPPANTTPPASTSSKPPTASTKPPTTSSKPTSSNPTSSKPPTTSPKPTTTAPMKPPGTPTAKSGAGKITLTFQPASGATPTRYRVGGVGAGMSVAPASVPATGPFMFTVTGGSCEKEYKFYIIAEYPGAVMNSKASTGVRPCVAAGKPTNLQAVTAAGGKAKVSWSAPTNTAGETVTYTGSWSVKAASTSIAKAAGPADGPLTVTPAVYGELIAEPPAVNFPTVADGTNAAAVAAAKSGSWTTTNKSVTLSVSGQSGSYTFKVSAKNSAGTTSSSTATLTITLAYGKVTSASIDMPPETPGSAPYPPTPSPGAPTNDERPDAVALAAVVAPNRRDVPVT